MNENWFEKIEEYLNGNLNGEERLLFESKLAENKELAAVFETYGIIEKDMRAADVLTANKSRETEEDNEAAYINTLKEFNARYFDIEEHPDQKYLDALVNNDRRLIKDIYEKYSGKITGWIINNNGTRDDAEDMISKALINLFRRAKMGYVLTVPFEGIFFRECRWEWLDELSKRKKSGYIKHLDEMSPGGKEEIADIKPESYDEELLERVFREMPKLNEKCQELIKLYFLGRVKIGELTVLLQYKNENTTRQALFKCLEKLRELLGEK